MTERFVRGYLDDAKASIDNRFFREQDRERLPLPVGYSAILMPLLERGFGDLYNEIELETEVNEFFARINAQGARIVNQLSVHVKDTGQRNRVLYVVERRPDDIASSSSPAKTSNPLE